MEIIALAKCLIISKYLLYNQKARLAIQQGVVIGPDELVISLRYLKKSQTHKWRFGEFKIKSSIVMEIGFQATFLLLSRQATPVFLY